MKVVRKCTNCTFYQHFLLSYTQVNLKRHSDHFINRLRSYVYNGTKRSSSPLKLLPYVYQPCMVLGALDQEKYKEEEPMARDATHCTVNTRLLHIET